MKKEIFKIEQIPAVIWGDPSEKVIIAVHGNMSSKSDVPIVVLAEEAINYGYQVLSFDLPEHGDRKQDSVPCKAEYCVDELKMIIKFAKTHYSEISLMANSMGAYFSLLAYNDESLRQCLFLSPVVDMLRIIDNMMQWFDISEEKLFLEKEISTPIGQTLYWDYYQYVKNRPIQKWDTPTSILYGQKDTLCEYGFVRSFSEAFGCNFRISEESEHYFHTESDMAIYRDWIRKELIK